MRSTVCALALILAACNKAAPTPLEQLRSGDAAGVKEAQAVLVAQGPSAIPALQAALKDNDLSLRRRAREALARITGQWGDGSGLLWRRSFDAAVSEAATSGKPILLLNLFGKFDEEFC